MNEFKNELASDRAHRQASTTGKGAIRLLVVDSWQNGDELKYCEM
jgi:hypothetical protein